MTCSARQATTKHAVPGATDLIELARKEPGESVGEHFRTEPAGVVTQRDFVEIDALETLDAGGQVARFNKRFGGLTLKK